MADYPNFVNPPSRRRHYLFYLILSYLIINESVEAIDEMLC